MGVPLFGQEHVDRYRETDGEEGHDWQGTTVLLLTTTGRNSGAKRTTPLIYQRHGDDYLVTGRFVVRALRHGLIPREGFCLHGLLREHGERAPTTLKGMPMARFGNMQPVPARIATIGVHDWDLASFLTALRGLERPFVVDVRQRRGVRGPQYAWANSQRLQRALEAVGIPYRHVRDLAPTTELRQLQYAVDDAAGVGKRSRQSLDPGYVAGYTEQILDPFDLSELLASLPDEVTPVLLCVEAEPSACHRSLVTARLASEHGLDVVHLRP